MKQAFRKTLCLVLSILLILPTAFSAFAQGTQPLALAEQGGIPVLETKTAGVPDGKISPNEYGSSEPTLHLTAENGFWAEDMTGNELTENLPNYVDLYLSRTGDALYVAVKVNQNAAHSGKEYFLTTFLGLSDDAEKGATTEFKLYEKMYTNRPELGTQYFFETIVTQLESNGGPRLYSIDRAYEYALPNWGSIKTEEDGSFSYLFEVALNFADSASASGVQWDGTLQNAHFAFDLALISGAEQVGVLHFNKAKSAGETVPDLSLTGGNPDLAELSSSGAESFAPLFSSEIVDYTIVVPFGTLPGITAKAVDENARVEIHGESELGTTKEGVIEILVYPANGAHPKQYNVSVIRQKVTTSYETDADNLDQLLQEIAQRSWSISDAVSIKLSGTYQNKTERLFNLPTIFTTSNTKLPITIIGTGNAKIEILTEKVFCANDFTFEKVSMPIGMTETQFYAGSGHITFKQVDFGVEKDASPKAKFFGDNYTKLAYDGWKAKHVNANQNSEKCIPSSITFGKGVNYLSAENSTALLAAVGFNGETLENASGVSLSITPEKLAPALIIDGATVSATSAKIGTAPVPSATVEVKSGTVSNLWGDAGVGTIFDTKSLKGDINITVSGGTVASIRPLFNTVLNGNTTISISQEDAQKNPTIIDTVLPSTNSEIKKNSKLNISGGTFTGEVSGSTANLSTINNISGGSFQSYFFGLGAAGSRRVYNNITGGIFNATFYGGHSSAGYIRGVINNVSGGIFRSSFCGGNRSGTLYGDVENNFTGGTFRDNVYGGNSGGSVDGTIKNKVNKVSFIKNFYGGNYNATATKIENTVNDSTFFAAFLGGSYKGTTTGDIVTCVQSSSMDNFGGAGASGTVNGNVTNNVSGAGTIVGYFGGSNSGSITVKGTITNTVSADKNGNEPTFNNSGSGIAYIGGSYDGSVKNVVNIINAGNFTSRYHGGSSSGTMGKDQNGVSVQNVINGGSYTHLDNTKRYIAFTAGSVSATMAGDTDTVINGGTFIKGVGFGTRAMPHDGYTGTYRSVINGGTFQYYVFGGNMGYNNDQVAAYHTQNVDMTINGGTFENVVAAGGWGANPVHGTAKLTITGGTFNDDVRAGSYTNSPESTGTSQIIIKQAPESNLIFKGTVQATAANQSVKLVTVRDKSNIQLTKNASLTIDEIEQVDDFQAFIATETLTKGKTYIVLKLADTETAQYSDMIRFLGEGTDSDAAILKTVTDTGATWVGTGKNLTVVSTQQLSGSPLTGMAEFQPTETRLSQTKVDALLSLTESNANKLTAQERRQMAIDYFTLQCSFTWTPDVDVSPYRTTLYRNYIMLKERPGSSETVKTVGDATYRRASINGVYRWVWDKDGNGRITSADRDNVDKYIRQGEYFGGIPYKANPASGNLYRWLEYYDENTGVMEMSRAIVENGGYDETGANSPYAKIMYNHCTSGAQWGWNRVINSVNAKMTTYVNVYNGYIPVGGFTYGFEHEGTKYTHRDIIAFGVTDTDTTDYNNPVGYDTENVITDWNTANGPDAMFNCYAKLQPGDCLLSDGHCLMVAEVNPVYIESGGTKIIDSTKSTVRVIEQIEGWAFDYDNRNTATGKGTTMKGAPYTRQGRIATDGTYTFKYLQDETYLPFTFLEYHWDVDSDESRSYVKFYNEEILQLNTENARHPKEEAFARLIKRSDIEYTAVYNTLTTEQKKLYNADLFLTVEEIREICSEKVDVPTLEVSQILKYKSINNKIYPTALGNVDLKKSYLTAGEYEELNLVSNYAISDVFVTITKNGTTIKEMTYRANSPNVHAVIMRTTEVVITPTGESLRSAAAEYADKGNNICITVQLGTGAKITVFDGYFGTR